MAQNPSSFFLFFSLLEFCHPHGCVVVSDCGFNPHYFLGIAASEFVSLCPGHLYLSL